MKLTKILHINESLCLGGKEKLIVDLCNHIDKNKYKVSLLILDKDLTLQNNLKDEISLINLNIEHNKLKAKYLFFNIFTFVKRIGKILKEGNYDIIHLHSYSFIYLALSISIFIYAKHIPVVKTIHTSGIHYSSNSIKSKFKRLLEIIATKINKTHIVGISKSVYCISVRHFKKYAIDFTLIYNGIDLCPYNKIINNKTKDNKKDIYGVYSSRIVNGKNHYFLVELWEALKNKGYNHIKLLLIGDGNSLNSIKNAIKLKGLSDNIKCLGYCTNVPQILSNCDFAVFPSEYEGFSLSLIEKMASSLPTICSDIPPFREIIEHEKNGYIINVKNKQLWINCIEELCNNINLRQTIGKNAKTKSYEFSIEQMTLKYENLYSTII